MDRALKLGRQLSRPVTVVYAHPLADGGEGIAEEKVRAVLPDPDADANIVVKVGSPPEAIAEAAEESDASIICTGVARYNSIGDFLIGNAVDYICRKSERPVLVVKNRPHRDYRQIIFPTDFSDSSRGAFERALELFPEARFSLLYAYHVPYAAWNKDEQVKISLDNESRAAMDEFLQAFADRPEFHSRIEGSVSRGNIFEAIYSVAAEKEANLVAFGTHGESGFRHASIGSMAHELLDKLRIDSLIIKSS